MNVKSIWIRQNTNFSLFSLLLPYEVVLRFRLCQNILFFWISCGIDLSIKENNIKENLNYLITFFTNQSNKSVKFTFMCAVSITFTTNKRPLFILCSNLIGRRNEKKKIIWWCHTQSIIIGCRDIPFAFRSNAICQKSTKYQKKNAF